jgi:hypothetical protein
MRKRYQQNPHQQNPHQQNPHREFLMKGLVLINTYPMRESVRGERQIHLFRPDWLVLTGKLLPN